MNFQQDLMIFYKYDKEIQLFQNPFLVNINDVKNNLQMKVIKLQNNKVLKDYFFWGSN